MNNNFKIKKILNHEFIFDGSGGVFIRNTKTLIISDLHFGKSLSMSRNGNFVPPYDIKETLVKLKKLVLKYNPSKIISLGDNFHDNFSILNLSNNDLKEIRSLTRKINFIWISGNHDNKMLFKEKVGGQFYNNLTEKPFNYSHMKKIENFSLYQFSGHFHPKISLVINNSKFNYKCFVLGKNFCILPAFGHYTGGLDVKSKILKKVIADKAELIVLGKNKMINQMYIP